jgi:DNA-binding NarL/FixJ family response regulator
MKPITVLLVDSNQHSLRVVTRFLQVQDNVTVVGAARESEEALTQTLELQPDIVLVDVSMPNGHGLESISRLRAARPTVGIIALAAVHTGGYWQAALAAGADDFIPKFAMSTNLLPAIRRIVQVSLSSASVARAAS